MVRKGRGGGRGERGPSVVPGTGDPARRGPDPWASALLLAALFVGLLRFVRLGEWSLWLDEALTLSDALHRSGAANPLGYWLIGFAVEAADGRPSEWQLRLVPALFGFAMVPLVAWAFRPAAGARAAAAAALFVAASSWHVYWSQTARFYTIAAFLALLGGGLALRGLLGNRTALAVVGLVVAATGALAHPTVLLLVGGLVVAPVAVRALGVHLPPRALIAYAAVGGVGLLLGLGWIGDLLDRWQDIKGSGNPAHFALTSGFHVTPWLGAAALLGVGWAVVERRRGVLLIAAVTVIGFAAAAATSFAARMTSQYVFAFLPWIALLAAAPLASSATGRSRDAGDMESGDRAVPWFSVALLVLVVAPSLVSTALYLTVRHGERPRWKEAYAYVFEHRREADLVFGMAAPVGEHYLTTRRTEVRDPVELVYLDTHRASAPGRWDRWPRRAWFVVNQEELYDWTADQRAHFRRMLREDCRLVASFPLEVESRDLSVWVYLRD